MSLTELRRRADELRRRQHDLLRANGQRAIRAARIATMPDAALNAMLANPKGLDRILADIGEPAPVVPVPLVAQPKRLVEEIEEQMRAEWDRDNCGDRFE